MKALKVVLILAVLFTSALIPSKEAAADHTDQKANWSVVWQVGAYSPWKVVADGWIVCEFASSKPSEAIAWAKSHSNQYVGIMAVSTTPTLQSVMDWLRANRPKLFAKDVVPVQLPFCVLQAAAEPSPTPKPDLPPVIEQPYEGKTFQVRRNERIEVQVTARDPEGKDVGYSCNLCPIGMEINETGLIVWNIPDTGMFVAGQKVTVLVEVSDSPQEKSTRRTFFIEILAGLPPTPTRTPTPTPEPKPAPPTPTPPTPVPDQEPTLDFPSDGWSTKIEVGKPWSIVAKGTDPEDQPVYFSLMRNRENPFPLRIGINAKTGEFFWKFEETFPSSSWDMRVCVSDRPEGYAESGGRGQCNVITLHVTNPKGPGGALPEENSDDNAQPNLQEMEQLVQQIRQEVEKLKSQSKVSGSKMGGGYEYPYAGIEDTFTFQEPLQKGTYHNDVLKLKKVLSLNLGIEITEVAFTLDPEKHAFYFGPKTFDAVCKFQEKYAKKILAPWGLKECNGFVGAETRNKLNQLLGEERTKRNNAPRFEGGTIRQYEPPLTEEELEELALGFTPHGAVAKLALPARKAVLSALKQKGDEVLNIVKTAPSKARPAAEEFVALVRLVPKLNAEAVEYLVKHPGDILRLARIVDKYGKEVLQYIHYQGFNPSLLNEHFSRHGARLGIQSELEYELLAKIFLNRPAGGTLLTKTRASGEIVRFDTVTEHFGVKAPSGTIETFYKPDPAIHNYRTNLDYFLAQ